MTLENVTIGSDPELFIINTKTGKIKSSVGLIPGTKEEPILLPELGEGYALQTDNILAEFNIPPVTSCNEFINSIELMKNYIRQYVKGIDENYDILCVASHKVPVAELKTKQARLFGCSPDYCVYTGKANPVTKATKTSLRSAGTHIHIGYDNPTIDRSLKLIKYLDAYIGVPSVIIDTDSERRKLYGKAGCFRLCKYGCEYRTLSSFWIADPTRMSWLWERIVRAINAAREEYYLPNSNEIQDCINNNNIQLAKELCNRYNLCAEFLE